MTYLIHQTPIHVPNRAPPWPAARDLVQQKTKINSEKTMTTLTTNPTIMKKARKKQDDRLLKRLSYGDRRKQLRLRQQIMNDPLFLVV